MPLKCADGRDASVALAEARRGCYLRRPAAPPAWTTRLRRICAPALTVALLAGCATGEPRVTSFDGSMVTIVQSHAIPQKNAKALADQTCGRRATQLSKICTDPKCETEQMVYWCR